MQARRTRLFTEVVDSSGDEASEVEQAMAGAAGAFEAILRRHDPRMRALASKLLGGDVHRMDDTLQVAYLQAYRGLARFRRGASIGTWLHRIMYNACIDELRREQRHAEPMDVQALPDRASAAAAVDDVIATQDDLLRALKALPPGHRAAVVLVDGEGFAPQAVADAFGVAAGTVASWLSRGRAALRQAMGEEAE